MRCGNCEEVCQAGIPHLPLYQAMQGAADAEAARSEPAPPEGSTGDERDDDQRARHVLLLERLRSSTRYTDRFLDVRPGGYIKRAPAALPGSARFVLLRAENADGPAATCIHCAACVDVCPTAANEEYQGADPRWITTLQERCIGCGTCVEVCPANRVNGGQTLRVMEAPTLDWLDAAREFAARERP
jgi:ferredoxin